MTERNTWASSQKNPIISFSPHFPEQGSAQPIPCTSVRTLKVSSSPRSSKLMKTRGQAAKLRLNFDRVPKTLGNEEQVRVCFLPCTTRYTARIDLPNLFFLLRTSQAWCFLFLTASHKNTFTFSRMDAFQIDLCRKDGLAHHGLKIYKENRPNKHHSASASTWGHLQSLKAWVERESHGVLEVAGFAAMSEGC